MHYSHIKKETYSKDYLNHSFPLFPSNSKKSSCTIAYVFVKQSTSLGLFSSLLQGLLFATFTKTSIKHKCITSLQIWYEYDKHYRWLRIKLLSHLRGKPLLKILRIPTFCSLKETKVTATRLKGTSQNCGVDRTVSSSKKAHKRNSCGIQTSKLHT